MAYCDSELKYLSSIPRRCPTVLQKWMKPSSSSGDPVIPSFSENNNAKPMNPNCVRTISNWDMDPKPTLLAFRAAAQWRVLTDISDLWALKQTGQSAIAL